MTDDFDEDMINLYYAKYKEIGGINNFKEYSVNCNVFLEHTLDIFCYGDPIKYSSRDEAILAVKKILGITSKEIHLIFRSIDEVTSYT